MTTDLFLAGYPSVIMPVTTPDKRARTETAEADQMIERKKLKGEECGGVINSCCFRLFCLIVHL